MYKELKPMLNAEELIKHYHTILKRGTSDERKNWFNVGDYKQLQNEVGSILTAEPKKVPIKNKYVNETKTGKISTDLNDETFEKEILKDLTM